MLGTGHRPKSWKIALAPIETRGELAPIALPAAPALPALSVFTAIMNLQFACGKSESAAAGPVRSLHQGYAGKVRPGG